MFEMNTWFYQQIRYLLFSPKSWITPRRLVKQSVTFIKYTKNRKLLMLQNKVITFFLISFIVIELQAQNLVPNYSFENHTGCPTFASQLNLASPWFNPTLGTPEYYNACAQISSYASVPLNLFEGFQYAKTGDGYAGIYVFRTNSTNMREYVEIALDTSLIPNKCYYFEMFVNLHNGFQYASDGIGAYFSTGPITSLNFNALPYNPQIANPSGSFISDTANWTLISGYFTAQGGENHLTIGNFKNDANTHYINIYPNAPFQNESYILIDDILLTPVLFDFDLGNDTIICEGDNIVLNAATPGATYLWQDGSTNATFNVLQEGTYWVTVFMGNCSKSDTIQIKYTSPPIINPYDSLLCNGQNLHIDVLTENATYLWNDGSTNSFINITTSGEYWVIISNQCGSITDSIQIGYHDCYCNLFVPNSFTPNNDEKNEQFFPSIECNFLDTYEFKIFNRWGELVFITNNQNEKWNGTYNGKLSTNGVYVWTLNYTGKNNGEIISASKYGKVSLIK